MTSDELEQLLESVRQGDIDIAAAVSRLNGSTPVKSPATESAIDAAIDLDRETRCGYPEVVYAEGKTTESVVSIFEVLLKNGQNCLATRVNAQQAEALTRRFSDSIHNETARTVRIEVDPQDSVGKVCVITAGTSDRPVAEEAVETLNWMNVNVELIQDVGVAGPQRLGEQRSHFADSDVIVVVAGMEGALPSVVGGHVDCPVIAVPTSVGYGANLAGFAALLGMLNSCASNVTVVNIDAGFKGGYVAGLIARKCAAARSSE